MDLDAGTDIRIMVGFGLYAAINWFQTLSRAANKINNKLRTA
jgi:hypothetical protein